MWEVRRPRRPMQRMQEGKIRPTSTDSVRQDIAQTWHAMSRLGYSQLRYNEYRGDDAPGAFTVAKFSRPLVLWS